MTRVTKGARQRRFVLWLGGSSGRRESESLVVSLFEKPGFTQSSISGFMTMLVNCESDYNPHTALSSQPGIHRASAHYRRLTNITLSKRYCSH